MIYQVNQVDRHLLLCSISVDDIDVDSVVDELVKEFFCSLLGLNEYQHRWLETLDNTHVTNVCPTDQSRSCTNNHDANRNINILCSEKSTRSHFLSYLRE